MRWAFRQHIREKSAISFDWNDLTIFNAMHIPEGIRLNAFISAAGKQPYVSGKEFERLKKTIPKNIRELSGGATQFWLWPIPDWIHTQPDFLRKNIGA